MKPLPYSQQIFLQRMPDEPPFPSPNLSQNQAATLSERVKSLGHSEFDSEAMSGANINRLIKDFLDIAHLKEVLAQRIRESYKAKKREILELKEEYYQQDNPGTPDATIYPKKETNEDQIRKYVREIDNLAKYTPVVNQPELKRSWLGIELTRRQNGKEIPHADISFPDLDEVDNG